MPDIPQPTGLPPVDPRGERRSQGGTDNRGLPSKRAVESYQEVDRARPPDDRITIIGIPIEQITSSTRAALAGLVAENATLRAQVRRLETRTPTDAPALPRDAFVASIGELTATMPPPGAAWTLFVVHVQTYEDIRRSTGLLAANSVLAEVAQRLQQATLTQGESPLPMTLVGSLGGLSLGALVGAPIGTDTTTLSQQLHQQLTAEGFDVAGLSMALVIKVAAVTVDGDESALLALARADHLTRGPSAAG